MPTLRVALFHTPSDTTAILEERTAGLLNDYVRMSEYVEVQFPEMTPETRLEQIARIRAAKEEQRKYYESRLADFDRQVERLQS